MKDGLHLSGKGAAVFGDELPEAVESGMGSIKNMFGSKHCYKIFYYQAIWCQYSYTSVRTLCFLI